jgi:molybdopterin/thiamine biosynthesis adenylyltransferase/rhodanese-related sulfurtransferase
LLTMNLSEEEIRQYQRHLSLPGFGPEAQGKLKEAAVLVVGAGGLGCPALQYLAAAGVGKIGIVDDDVVDASNLQRQVLYTHDDIGQSKAEVAANRLAKLNPYVEIVPLVARLSRDNAKEALEGYEIVVDGTDSFNSRYLINDACVLFDKVLVYGAIHQFEGQVSVFNLGDGPTYRCLFPEPPPAGTVPNCAEIGVVGVLPGIIGCMQALEVIKVVTGIGNSLSGKLLLYDAMTNTTRTLGLSPNPESLEIVELPEETSFCGTKGAEVDSGVVEIVPVELVRMMKENPDLLVLDVREDWERELSRIDPSSHCPLGEFSRPEGPSLPVDFHPGREVVVYCKAGVRSRMACEGLEALGYSKLYNLSGGMIRWSEDVGLPPPVG